MIKYIKKEETFIIIDRNRTMIYDSRIGFLELNALSLKDELESSEMYKLIAYMKPLLVNATDRAVVKKDIYQFYFKKHLTLNNKKIQNDVLLNETTKTHGIESTLTIIGILASSFMIYNCINPDTTVRTAAQVTAHASHVINRTDTLFNYA